ncbi:tRNA uridine-5-carboxymethylaminomethyl(34) synthesis GTPase MnmE [Rickettsiales bacterium]|nr:tRNA uridine-5-carboxymethylaminomethyl(34) synthesis GTPase MnmE [Rickettsiales bacterium]MDB2550352.1 tRNA uridine-5-carboxymethylaminomethyl(34) synthesis GTPase MnmE [Rickettsiales bacterium]
MADTIFAHLGYCKKSALILFRISGESALDSLSQLGVTKIIKDRKATLCNLIDPDDKSILDQSIITYFKSPHSYTGEDVIEISCHPSSYIINRVVAILLKINNFRYAKEGEFTKLALLNNKIDLIQAESILDIINSKTKYQHKQAISQLSGHHSAIYNNWRNDIINIIANLESSIDFPDEDLPTAIIKQSWDKINILTNKISQQLQNNFGQKIKEGISIVILGDPNVGKSTLMNYINQKDISIISNIAGTTRDIVESYLDIAGYEVVISDTAGIRESNDIIEKQGIKKAINKIEQSDIKIIILESDNLKSDNLKFYDQNSILLINKIDIKDPIIDATLSKKEPILISLEKNMNLDQIYIAIENKIKNIIGDLDNDSLITNQRHRNNLEKTLLLLKEISFEDNIEITAEKLRSIAYQIGQITGDIAIDDILDVIFLKFCIGK